MCVLRVPTICMSYTYWGNWQVSKQPANSWAHRTAQHPMAWPCRWNVSQTKDLLDTHLKARPIDRSSVWKIESFKKTPWIYHQSAFHLNQDFSSAIWGASLLVQVPHRTSDALQRVTQPNDFNQIQPIRFSRAHREVQRVWRWENAPTTFQNPDTCLGNLEVEVTQGCKFSHNRMRRFFSKAFFFLNWCEHIYVKV